MRKVIVATHGELSKGIVHTLGMIVGEDAAAGIQTFSLYPGDEVSKIAADIEAAIEQEEGQTDYVIFTDVAGGSVDNHLLRLVKLPNVWLISGVNLIMLLEVVLNEYVESTDTVVEQAIESAHQGIHLRKELPVSVLDDEDDF